MGARSVIQGLCKKAQTKVRCIRISGQGRLRVRMVCQVTMKMQMRLPSEGQTFLSFVTYIGPIIS